MPNTRFYTIGNVVRALRAMNLPVEERTARSWREERVGLRLEGGELGRYQIYTFRDALAMAAMAAMVKAGVSASFAAGAVNTGLGFWRDQEEFYLVVTDSPEGTVTRNASTVEDIATLLNPPDHVAQTGFLYMFSPTSMQIIPVHRLAVALHAALDRDVESEP